MKGASSLAAYDFSKGVISDIRNGQKEARLRALVSTMSGIGSYFCSKLL
jgi:hypothetical protein